MEGSTRRRFLRTTGVVGIAGLAGCSQITGEDDIKDTDGDGVIDSEDYAPRDPDVQREEQVDKGSTSEEAESEPTTSGEAEPSEPTDTESTNNQIEATPVIRLNDELPSGFENRGATRQESNGAVGSYVWNFNEDYILSDYAWGTTDHSGTLCCWVYIPNSETNNSDYREMISAHDGGRDGDYEFEQLSLRQSPDGEGIGIHKNKKNSDAASALVSNFPVSEWFHLAGVVDKDQNELRTYINGEQRASVSDYEITMEQKGNFGIGARAKHRFDEYEYIQMFIGKLDDVRIYEEPLNDDEINILANL